ncbi:unnamed protein product [Notodromas monacha]|uniref:Gustatory receptor n=1 Tax=Notodromas monacha TaxID=399045 RepID=A0A7R9BQ20_9CRUS|nr:unnamed protein product [Notodromas monacha]CAG0919545.1 unnamed protein product [Notodromas monacha]
MLQAMSLSKSDNVSDDDKMAEQMTCLPPSRDFTIGPFLMTSDGDDGSDINKNDAPIHHHHHLHHHKPTLSTKIKTIRRKSSKQSQLMDNKAGISPQRSRRLSILGRVALARARFKRVSASRESIRKCYSRYPLDFHSFLYHGFQPLRWWGLLCGMFPLVKDSSEATLTPYAIVGAPKLRFRWERVHVVYGLSLIGFSVYLSTRGVTKWLNPGQNCFEALGTNLSIATVVTKFDHCVQGSTEMLAVPSALLTMICFALHFKRMEEYFNRWQKFEMNKHYIAAAMEKYVKRALLVTYSVGTLVLITFMALFFTKVVIDPVTGCHRDAWGVVCAVARNAIRVFGAHFVDAFFLYLTLSVATCFEALKAEILRVLRTETGANQCLLVRRIAHARRTYLSLCEFVEMIEGLFTPQLLFTVVFLTYFCIANLYLVVILASFGGDTVEIVCYTFIFAEVTLRLLVFSIAGNLMCSKSEEIQKILQHLDSSHWPKNAQKQLEFFILSTISLGTPNITASGFFSMRRPMFTANIRDCSGAAGEGAAVSRQARLLVTCNAGEGEPVPGLSRTFENFQRFPLSSPPARVYITLRQFYQW